MYRHPLKQNEGEIQVHRCLFPVFSGKIDIATQPFFAGIFNELEQMGRFRLMRAAADQDDEAGMVSPGGEFQKSSRLQVTMSTPWSQA